MPQVKEKTMKLLQHLAKKDLFTVLISEKSECNDVLMLRGNTSKSKQYKTLLFCSIKLLCHQSHDLIAAPGILNFNYCGVCFTTAC